MAEVQPPKHVVMLAFQGAQILDVVGPLQILAAVNDERPKSRPAYRLTLLCEHAGQITTSSKLKLVADGSWKELPRAIDTLMVAGGEGTRAAIRNNVLLDSIRKGAARSRRIVSVCSGAFLLAEAGLLDGKRATTHWRNVDDFSRSYPKIAIEPDAIYVRDGRIWTSAGVTAGMDLALALVRDDFGDEMALAIARRHVLFLMRPGGQSQFSAHLSVEARPKGKLGPLLHWIPEHVGDRLAVPVLARQANMSERNFARVFRTEIGVTPAHYVEVARIDAARRLLTQSRLSIATIAVRAGFGSEERMRRVFQRHLKISPASFRARFHSNGDAG